MPELHTAGLTGHSAAILTQFILYRCPNQAFDRVPFRRGANPWYGLAVTGESRCSTTPPFHLLVELLVQIATVLDDQSNNAQSRERDDAETDYQFFRAGRAFWNCETQASLFHDLRRWRGHLQLSSADPHAAQPANQRRSLANRLSCGRFAYRCTHMRCLRVRPGQGRLSGAQVFGMRVPRR